MPLEAEEMMTWMRVTALAMGVGVGLVVASCSTGAPTEIITSAGTPVTPATGPEASATGPGSRPATSGTGARSSRPTGSPTTSGGPGAVATAGGSGSPTATDQLTARRLPAAEATRLATTVGAQGTVRQGWSWSDAAGRHTLLATEIVVHRTAGAAAHPDEVTTKLIHVGHNGTRPKVLDQVMDDNGGRCDVDLGVGIVDGSVTVTDADHDGNGEVSIGWWHSCRGDPGAIPVRLAVFTQMKHFVVRGVGQVRGLGVAPTQFKVPPVSATAEPGRDAWLDGLYEPTISLYRKLFV